MIEVSPCCGQGDFLCTALGVSPGDAKKTRLDDSTSSNLKSKQGLA
jgi:hypothetical protein